MGQAFVLRPTTISGIQTALMAEQLRVEVCGFKDCKRAGGGQKLEKLINQIVEEENLDHVVVESCDCQGECGYGPNVVLNGKIVNGVRGKEAVRQALGLAQPVERP